ncbi:triphosphoribosyl-dephospho-CoA protein [Hyphomicrobium denitrificans ATCC 51888]|uniref:Triphosphoribosyl-dephospho-CoA protein n=1 Tax=Hyphomicrobium denitrificans (strain ATCC 51888 / DSM 1869 / NCIMB 11706 / TK 0415) TaxID=582899 RepID=D8JXS8_HYPDA|nr:triphosphoribosyl-dephospho-CoA synthase [Hyphomicrobium denitrificans]ADJ23287.1 triphosphoribosyl-dephospho-CoA protein [Hyphomicrobium denitrificans ATCC 51888]
MTTALNPEQISSAFLAACRAELDALKPGNVHRHSAGHGMDVAHFERAAEAAAGPIADPSLSVGKRILRATEASVAATGLNTNLGIVLLSAPLAKAASETTFAIGLRRRLDMILAALDEQDATDAFAAIRIANPAGLGHVDEGDVRDNPDRLTLIKAMYLAAERDRIANAYVTAYSDIFDFALPVFQDARRVAIDSDLAVTTLHMSLLAEFPDTHIARKYGAAAAEEIREQARALKAYWSPVASAKSMTPLIEFDAIMKSKGRNPGTTADFVVATLFVAGLIGQKPA